MSSTMNSKINIYTTIVQVKKKKKNTDKIPEVLLLGFLCRK